MRLTTFSPVSNAEGTRVVAQSDGAGRADAEQIPDAERPPGAEQIPDAGDSGARTAPGAEKAEAGQVTEAEKAPGGTPEPAAPASADPADPADPAVPTDLTAQTAPMDAVVATAPAARVVATAPVDPVVTTTPVDPAELELTRPRGLPGLFWKDLAQVDFGPRRFRLGPARERLETVSQSFLTGFNAVIAGETGRIDDIHEELRGFAYEGAGMACTTLDVLTITGGRRLRDLLSGQGMRYPHMIHMGAGWAYARLHMRPMWGIRSVHPLLRWLAFDGFGFHQGFFATDRTVGRQRSAGLMDRTRRAIFDQGLGRMLWFHECAGVDDVILRIAEFPPGRRADLWSGVGLAATYTGGASAAELERLSVAAAEDGFRAHLVQGSAFACASRLISGIVPEHTVAATPALCGVEVDEAGGWTDTALIALGHNAHSGDHYQIWRAGIRKAWARRNRDS
ncbi:Protein of unknown function [Streptosporangium canum]|uniref:DUF1702 family protein n=1 Tax=Streptosporangium canum TaxID=324952 RepID=A0A1I3TE54_9ACTN|nr:Protein of unknown function [Streptosporangium canum]